MRVAFVDWYGKGNSPHKDPISIPLSLVKLGHDAQLVSLDSVDEPSCFGLTVKPMSEWLARDIHYDPPDAVVMISRFDQSLTTLVRQIRDASIPIVIKGDTDGTLGYPLVPNYLRARPLMRRPLNWLRYLKWRFPISRYVLGKLEHVKLADRVVCESPGAAVNLSQILQFWGMQQDLDKIATIPNPVSSLSTSLIIPRKTPGRVIAVGRWDDAMTKGADLLAGVVENSLRRMDGLEFVIVGKGGEYVSKRLPSEFAERVIFAGELPYEETQHLIASSEIVLVPSRLESFSFVAAEGVCLGASVVVTPIESLVYLSGGGRFGSIAKEFSVASISAALAREVMLWRSHQRNSSEIASRCRAELAGEVIIPLWEDLLEGLIAQKTASR